MENLQTGSDCLFCKIIKGEEPADTVYQNESFIVIKDKYPNAPTHLLIIPKKHIDKHESLFSNFAIWEEFLKTSSEVVTKLNIGDSYQLVINSLGLAHFKHEHLHLIAGKDLFE